MNEVLNASLITAFVISTVVMTVMLTNGLRKVNMKYKIIIVLISLIEIILILAIGYSVLVIDYVEMMNYKIILLSLWFFVVISFLNYLRLVFKPDNNNDKEKEKGIATEIHSKEVL